MGNWFTPKLPPVQPGTVVRLKSGDPYDMTVEEIYDGVATCVWFDCFHRVRRENFCVVALKAL